MNVVTPSQPVNAKAPQRRAVVLITVLIVIVLLALAGYQYADMMMSEYKASVSAHKAMQAQKFADSGIYYAAAMLSNPNNYTTTLMSNPWNNPQAFDGIPVQGDGNTSGFFKIIAPPNIDDPSSTMTYMPGVQDECAKINVNAWMLVDSTGQSLYTALMTFPNMTAEIANNIIAWLGGSYGINNGGMGDSSYMTLTTPYHCKNGPIDSIDELLLVQGVTWDLLYGTDLNRNGTQEDGELGANGFVRGWSAFLTTHSREQNYDNTGNPYVFLNNTDLTQLYGFLQDANVSDDLAKFIIMYRQYGPSTSTGGSQSLGSTLSSLLGGGNNSNNNSSVVQGTLGNYQLQLTGKAGNTQIKSIFALCNAYVSISAVDPNTKKQTTTVYASPLNDVSSQRELLPVVFQSCTTTAGTEIVPRVNVNTAPSAVLTALPGLQAADVQTILSTRPDVSQGQTITDIFLTPAWLLTEAQLSLKQLQALEQYVTARTQVYRVQSVGYFDLDGKTPAIRVEAVIDTNMGRPRILAWRNLSELGKGVTNPATGGTTTNP